MRDSFIFYRSFYESLKTLKSREKQKLFEAICEYALNGAEIELTGAAEGMFKLLKPQLDANNRRYENGLKGGRPRKHTKKELVEGQKVRNSAEYKAWQTSVFERDGYTCQLCGSKTNLHAHHKLDFYKYPDKRFDVDNGLTLCGSCHSKIHTDLKNLEITENKPSDNLAITYKKRNVNDNDNVNVNVNVNDNHNDNVLGSSSGGGSGIDSVYGIEDEFNIWKKLTPEDVDAIYDSYPNSGGDLIQAVYEDVKKKRKKVGNAVPYILGYADKVLWDDNAEHGEVL